MQRLRGLKGVMTGAALAAMTPSIALAHPGHGADAAHTHTEWFVVAAVAAVVSSALYLVKRNRAE